MGHWQTTIIQEHGSRHYIIARLSLQIFKILENCQIEPSMKEDIQKIYIEYLMPKLMHCWEIKEKYRKCFNEKTQAYCPSSQTEQGKSVNVPFIIGLDAMCHDFLYTYKNFVRDILLIFNNLYKTYFKEASEFYRGDKKKKTKSLIDYAQNNFGENDPKTNFIKEAKTNLENYISMRNAVEHPGEKSGFLKISNFVLCGDEKVEEPCCWCEQNGKEENKSSIRKIFEVGIHDLMTLAEDILISWANENLKIPSMMSIICIPKDQRDKNCPIKYEVIYFKS